MKKGKAFNKIVEAIGAFLKLHGWNVLVIGDIQVIKKPSSLKYNYQLVISFTGKKVRVDVEK